MNYDLSKREQQVLKLLLSGYLQKQVATELGISESRVQDIKSIIKKKWGVDSDIEFILTAVRKGFLEVENKHKGSYSHYSVNSSDTLNVFYSYAPSRKKNVRIMFE